MSLLDVLRSGVRTIDKITKAGKLQTYVGYQRYLGDTDGGKGPRSYAATVQLLAIVDYRQQSEVTGTGEYAKSVTKVTFLDIAALLAATNNKGLDDNDLIVPPLGPATPILSISGFVDSGTKVPVATEATLG